MTSSRVIHVDCSTLLWLPYLSVRCPLIDEATMKSPDEAPAPTYWGASPIIYLFVEGKGLADPLHSLIGRNFNQPNY